MEFNQSVNTEHLKSRKNYTLDVDKRDLLTA